DDADPPVALEITSLQAAEWLAANSRMDSFKEYLQRHAREEGLGGWNVCIYAGANQRRVRGVALELMRRGQEIRPGEYTVQDLEEADNPAGLIQEHRRLAQLGLW